VQGCRLTLVAGPPGAGKTTLLSSWIKTGNAPPRLAWVTLDAHDDAPTHFWRTVLASLAACDACPTGRLEPIVVPPFSVVTGDLPMLIAGALPDDDEPTVLVLDELHEVRNTRVLDGIAELLRIAPASFRMVISTRHDPRLPLPRMRVAGQLAEIRAADLAFTPDEARELLVGHGLSLPAGDVETLVQRTEGWVAALALTAMSLRGSEDPGRQITRIAGDERAVADYLATEILDELSTGTREFLVRTAILDRVCGPLADALTGSRGGAEMLEELERRNCFVVGLDDRRHWFRYHRLFLELLRSRLPAFTHAERRELHRRAATWLADNGLGVEAIEHAIVAEEWRFAVDLIAEHWMDAFLSGRSASLRPLLEGLPAEFVEREAGVAVALAGIHLDAGDIVRADRFLAIGRAALSDADRDGRKSEQLGVVALLRARCHGDLEAAVRIADEVLAANGTEEPGARQQPALVLLLLGATEVWTDRLGSAARNLRAAVAQARFAEQEYLVLGGLGHLAIVEVAEGRLEPGAALAREALAIAERRDWLDAPQAASALMALGWAQLHMCDAAAAGTLEHALLAARSSSDMPLRQATAALRALAALEGEGARRGLDILAGAGAENAGTSMPALVDRLVRGIEARLLLATGDEQAALDTLAKLPPSATTGVLRARHALSRADPGSALRLLEPCLGSACADADTTTRTEALVLEAVAHHRSLDNAAAADSLERALALADADRSLWVFMQAGASMRELLARQLRHGTAHRGLVESLIVRLEQLELTGGASAEPLLEPLSARERALLSYLETMLSTEEIARELFVSANTVKSHTKSVYRKLGVTRRRQAVLRGRALRLL
jgi:LuxR family maltose regulon positive regulatory protein